MSPRIGVLLLAAFTASGCFWEAGDDALQGYVEGDFLDVGAEETGRLVALEVVRGDRIDADAVLFRIDDSDARAARTEAAARLSQARAQLADLRTGKREEEIDVLQAQRDELLASLTTARNDFQRNQSLHASNIVSDARIEDAEERFKVIQARIDSIEAQIEVARLPARADTIRAAEDAVDAASASVMRIEARISRLTGTAPAAGSVQDTFFEPGEVVPAGRPVVSLLPPENLKIRFFVPEERLAGISIGDAVSVNCDGCAGTRTARVTFISQAAEFTPPVIYSVHARRKLVYMVEAHPDDVTGLKVGQPVDVRLVP
ncbi:HlyD family secretion protein [Microbaculum marinum]|uniref:HlyD family efflux transporter periplasmic adaptor subunit n=1 Tax=Microbaculum marinum TaxID=1764581 RepID=A0AAW9RLE3_9HYPH